MYTRESEWRMPFLIALCIGVCTHDFGFNIGLSHLKLTVIPTEYFTL